MDILRQGRPRPSRPALPLWYLLSCWFLVGHVTAQSECYVCGPQDGLLAAKPLFGNAARAGPASVLPCDGFTTDDARFRRRCPTPFEGCLHESDDKGNVARSCGNMPGNMCHKANNITYCYCTKSLCNAWATGGSDSWSMPDHGYVGDSAYGGGDGHPGDGRRYSDDVDDDDDDEDRASFDHSGGGPPPPASSPSLAPGGPIPPSPTARPGGAAGAPKSVPLVVVVSVPIIVLYAKNLALL